MSLTYDQQRIQRLEATLAERDATIRHLRDALALAERGADLHRTIDHGLPPLLSGGGGGGRPLAGGRGGVGTFTVVVGAGGEAEYGHTHPEPEAT